jgi:hypothetical protein
MMHPWTNFMNTAGNFHISGLLFKFGKQWSAGFNFDAAQAHTKPWNEETRYRLKVYDRLAIVERRAYTG